MHTREINRKKVRQREGEGRRESKREDKRSEIDRLRDRWIKDINYKQERGK